MQLRGSRVHRLLKSASIHHTIMLIRLRAVTLVSSLLIFALVHSAIPVTSAQQQTQRERRVSTQEKSATPSPNLIPKTATTTRTLAELQARISEVLRKPELASAIVAIKVASLDTGRVLFDENADKLLRPASNMKIYTVATALDRLSPDFRFATSVYAPARPDVAGVVHGDLTIYG